jgi:hypothetical protein
MELVMKYLLLVCALAFPAVSMADDEAGFFLGAGAAANVWDDCNDCDADGYGLQAGYYFNNIVGVDVKVVNTEFEYDSDLENEVTYYGVNIGHTFNTSWVRFYGKAGYLKLKEKDAYFGDSFSDSSVALGLGAMFTPFGHQSGLYFIVESVTADIFDETMGLGHVGLGYQF